MMTNIVKILEYNSGIQSCLGDGSMNTSVWTKCKKFNDWHFFQSGGNSADIRDAIINQWQIFDYGITNVRE